MGLYAALPKGSLETADPNARSKPLTGPGDFILKVKSQRVSKSTHPKTKGSILTVFDVEVQVSTDPDHPVDSRRIVKFTVPTDDASQNKRDKVLGNLMQLVGALEGIDGKEITGDHLDDLEAKPFKYEGVEVVVNMSDEIRPDGAGYSYFIPTAYPATDAECARVRKLAGVTETSNTNGSDDDIPF